MSGSTILNLNILPNYNPPLALLKVCISFKINYFILNLSRQLLYQLKPYLGVKQLGRDSDRVLLTI